MSGFLGGSTQWGGGWGVVRKTEGQMLGLGHGGMGSALSTKARNQGRTEARPRAPEERLTGCGPLLLVGLEACCQRSLLCFASRPSIQSFFLLRGASATVGQIAHFTGEETAICRNWFLKQCGS